jgi:hypothetical protein
VAWQGPAYPYLLGFVYWLTGSAAEMTGKILNIALSMLTIYICWFIYAAILKKPSHAIAAFTITAFLPQYVMYVNVLGTEILFVFLLSVIVCGQLYFGNRWQAYPIVGILIGISALVKPFMIAYPAVCVLTMWLSSRKWKMTLFVAFVVAVPALLAITPWTIRNYMNFGRFIPVTYNGGAMLYTNYNNGNRDGLPMELTRAASFNQDEFRVINNALLRGERSVREAHELEPYLARRAFDWIGQNPGEVLKLGVMHVYHTFFSDASDIRQWAMNKWAPPQRTYNLVYDIFSAAAFTVNVAGFLLCLLAVGPLAVAFFTSKVHPENLAILVFLNVAFFVAVVFAMGGDPRYAFPVYLFTIPSLVALCTGFNALIPNPVEKPKTGLAAGN